MAENRTNTSTQIRNMYSDGMAYLNIQFFNNNLSFKFQRFISKDSNGKSLYDSQNYLMTTVDGEKAAAIYTLAKDICDGKEVATTGAELTIQCLAESTLVLSRRSGPNGQMETFFTINKGNQSIPFKFATITYQQNKDGQVITKVIESGLKYFVKTINGYLEGINADRHLNKLTEDYIKSIEGDSSKQNNYQNNQNWKNNSNFKKGNNNYRGGYQNYQNKNNQQSWGGPPNQQNMSTYNVPQ